MPTPGERRALIFIASVAALGVAVRGWREFHPQDTGALAGSRSALARQIEAVDSAISVSSSKRKPRVSTPRTDTVRAMPRPRASRVTIRERALAETLPRDPRQAYWDRSLHVDSIRLGLEPHAERSAARRLPSQLPSAARRLPSRESPPVDLDIASIDEIAELPLIGAALARRIVQERITRGPFGSIFGLERIPGLTPAFARRLAPFVTFSLSPRLRSAGQPSRSRSVRPMGGDARP